VRKLLILFIAPILLSFSTCGRRGKPLPPVSKLPKPPLSIKAKQVYDRVLLSWTPPSQFTDGRRIAEKGELSFLVMVGFRGKTVPVRDSFFIDKRRKPGEKVCYKVASIYMSKYRGAFSEPACIRVEKPIGEVPKLTGASAGDGFVKLTFAPSTFDIAIYRKRNGKFPPEPLKVLKAGETVFTDRSVVNGRRYTYTARFRRGKVEGRATEEVTLMPADNVPPEPPRNLSILKGKPSFLIWEPSGSADLKLYEVYRNGRIVAKVNRGIYFPIDNLKGCFKVIAVDRNGNRSSSNTVCTEER